jgi:hypothetical protein
VTSSTGQLIHWRLAQIAATSAWFSGFSHHICASIVAIRMALAAFGILVDEARAHAERLLGCLFQSSPVVIAV